MTKTGWPPGLLQDDCRKLHRWFASRLDARHVVRNNFGDPMKDIDKQFREQIKAAYPKKKKRNPLVGVAFVAALAVLLSLFVWVTA